MPASPVVIEPPAPPQVHPLAPESVPNKPQTIPEEMPGATKARPTAPPKNERRMNQQPLTSCS